MFLTVGRTEDSVYVELSASATACVYAKSKAGSFFPHAAAAELSIR